ncbi:MAG: DNA gyrase subunit B [Chloroflexota bacterium]|nr:MAG: DNA gyrase subunit B [Chloroflexota bacterium]
MATTMTYSAEHIKRLEGLEAVRRLPGMYIGNNGVYGLHHLLMEPIDNAVDEILNGHGDTIQVTLHGDGSASVQDNARGIPVEYKPDVKMSALTEVLTMLHAGGKFREDGQQDAYLSGSGGLHGIGVKATNAFSEWLVVEIRRNGVIYRQRFENGGKPVRGVQIIQPGNQKVVGEINADTKLETERKSGLLTGLKAGNKTISVQADPNLGTGTLVHFRPHRPWFDPDMEWPRPDKNVPWDFNRLALRLEQVAHLHPGVRIELHDERGPKKDHKKRLFFSQKGLLDYMASLNEGLDTLHKPIQFKDKNDDGSITLEVVMQYAGEETAIYSFVNSIPTPQGGTAVRGFQAGLTKAVNQFGADKKLLKEGNIRGEDLLLGLTAIVNVTMTKTPQFSSQTKESLTTTEVQGVTTSITYENLLAYLNKNIPVGKVIINQALAAQRGREAAKAARQLVIRKSALEVSELPGKLADVTRGTPVEQTMLFLVEGDSAGGSAKQGRDRRYHAILPLRGKILNTERISVTKVLSNNEVKAIVAAIGGGIGADFKVEDMRYGGVAILTDADVDGSHIRTLLHTLFWRHLKPLVQAGKLYVAVAPLYQLHKGKETRYAYSEEERDSILKKWGREGVTIQRYKGLGEMNPAQLRETVFALNKTEGANPVINEHMLQVMVEDAHQAGHIMSVLMSSDVGPRKHWLLQKWAGEEAAWNGNGDEAADAKTNQNGAEDE